MSKLDIDLSVDWQVAGGSVMGTLHQHPLNHTNNQDVFDWYQDENMIIAVVTDGCGSSRHSEVGAKLGCRLVAEQVRSCLEISKKYEREIWSTDPIWGMVRGGVLRDIHTLATSMGGDYYRTIKQYFLFTIVCAIVTKQRSLLFSVGDGFAAINGEQIDLGDYPEDAPPYMAYSLIENRIKDPTPKLYEIYIHRTLATAHIDHIVIGTDGVGKYLLPVPGFELPELWKDDKYFQNPDQVRRRLAVINKTNLKRRGPLKDDTTLIVLRRKPRVNGK